MERKRPPLEVLEKIFGKGDDAYWAMSFVNIATTFPAVIRVEAVYGRRSRNSVPLISVIHRQMSDEEKDKMVRELKHSELFFGRDLKRVRFDASTVDETTRAADREDSADIAGKKIVPLWEREETAV